MPSSPADRRTTTGRTLIEAIPMVLVPAAFLLALPWLRALGGPTATLAGSAAAIVTVAYGNYFLLRRHRRLDELHQASAGFSALWGMQIGQAAFVLLLLLPPFKNWAVTLVTGWAGHVGSTVNPTVVALALVLGFCIVVLLQALGVVVMNVLWWNSKR